MTIYIYFDESGSSKLYKLIKKKGVLLMAKAFTPNIKSDKGKGLTKYVAEFVYKNKFTSIPKKEESSGKNIF